MTAPDIRAQAIEVLARASYAAWKDQYDQFEREAGGRNFAPDYDDSRRWPERELVITSATRSVDALAEAGLLPTQPDAYAVLSKRDGDGTYQLSGPWDDHAAVFVDQVAADDAKVNWEVDLIECGKNPDVFVLAEIRVLP